MQFFAGERQNSCKIGQKLLVFWRRRGKIWPKKSKNQFLKWAKVGYFGSFLWPSTHLDTWYDTKSDRCTCSLSLFLPVRCAKHAKLKEAPGHHRMMSRSQNCKEAKNWIFKQGKGRYFSQYLWFTTRLVCSRPRAGSFDTFLDTADSTVHLWSIWRDLYVASYI